MAIVRSLAEIQQRQEASENHVVAKTTMNGNLRDV